MPPPPNFPPITPITGVCTNGLQVTLSFGTICNDNVPAPTPLDNLLEQLSTVPFPWVTTLWHWICPAQPLHSLITALQTHRQVIICSDTTVDAAKYSCCVWTIWATNDLWHGEGIVPGHPDDTYSSQLEAFGILMALMFLMHYLSTYPIITPTNLATMIVYCNSTSVITWINWHLAMTTIFPTTLSRMTSMFTKKFPT